MKRKRILTQYLLYFLMLMFLLVGGCSSGGDDDDDAAPAVDYWITVSGTVTTAGGTPVSGVMMQTMYQLELLNVNLWEGSIDSDLFNWILTDSSGNYSITLPAGLLENYTLVITPVKKGYTFTPANRTLTIAGVDQAGVNFTATLTDEFSQSDLTGIWRVNVLRAGAEQWLRARIDVNASGNAACLSYETSAAPGVTDCPQDFELTMTMGTGDDDGVVAQSGNYATASHMTMASNKQLMAGTGTVTRSSQLTIAQKEPTDLTRYAPADMQNKDFVFHSLIVGGTNEWRYGSAYTDAAGLIAQDAGTEFSSGVAGETLNGLTVAIDANGVVTIAEIPTFEGFLSADEKTVVGTYSSALAGDYGLMVIQISAIGQATSMTGASFNHLLATGATPFWAYHDVNITRFETTFLPDILELSFALDMMLSYNWDLSSIGYTAAQELLLINLERINFNASGQATILDSATDAVVFHGQLAYDGAFMVGVETMNLTINNVATDCFTLNVITH